MAGKFEIYKDKKRQVSVPLEGSNGEIIAVGEAYESKGQPPRNGV